MLRERPKICLIKQKEENVANKTCNGFAVVYFNEEEEKFESKGYINCKKYTTKGYKDVVDLDKKNLKK